MGSKFYDQYSLLHFSVGVIFFFWNFSLLTSFLIHLIFELTENTPFGIYIIDNYIYKYIGWPGKKLKADSFINSFGDNVFFILGWLVSYYLSLHSSL